MEKAIAAAFAATVAVGSYALAACSSSTPADAGVGQGKDGGVADSAITNDSKGPASGDAGRRDDGGAGNGGDAGDDGQTSDGAGGNVESDSGIDAGDGGIVSVSGVCTPDGHWCLYDPYPIGGNIYSVWGTSTTDLWVAGWLGTLRFDGATWTRYFLNAVGLLGTGKTDLWANLGQPNNGQRASPNLAHWDGSHWSVDLSASALNLTAIWPESPTDVFGVGPVGAIMHFDGTQWSKQASGTVYDLVHVWGFGPNDAWAADAAGQIVLHYDGSRWSSKSTGLSVPFVGQVWGMSSSDYWLCGTRPPDGAYHFTGGVWTPVYTAGTVSSCFGRSANDVMFLLSGFGASEWTGSDAGASLVNLPVSSGQLSTGTYVVWATGGEYVVGSDPSWGGNALAHGSPASWTMYTHGSGGGSIGDLVWEAGGGMLYTVASSPGASMPGTFAKFSTASGPPGTWTPGGPIGTDKTMHAIWGSAPNDVWVVGDNGIATHYDGNAWTAQSIQTAALTDVWGSAPNDFWATGGTSHHYDGQQWTASGPGGAVLSGTARNDVWLAGGSSASHWDGSTWTAFNLDLMLGGNSIARINAFAANDAWLVTTLGDVFHWNGTTWSGNAAAYCPEGADGGSCASALIAPSGNGAYGFVWNASGDGWLAISSTGFWHTTGKNFDRADIVSFEPPASAGPGGMYVGDPGQTIGVPGSVWAGGRPLWKLQ